METYEDTLQHINAEDSCSHKSNYIVVCKRFKPNLVTAIQAQIDGGWLPIESAPKDGTYSLLGTTGQAALIGFWNGESWDDGEFNDYIDGVTHWQPLPTPPKE